MRFFSSGPSFLFLPSDYGIINLLLMIRRDFMEKRIVLIGAGSAQFGYGTIGDILQSKVLEGSHIVLHDINPDTLAVVEQNRRALSSKSTSCPSPSRPPPTGPRPSRARISSSARSRWATASSCGSRIGASRSSTACGRCTARTAGRAGCSTRCASSRPSWRSAPM